VYEFKTKPYQHQKDTFDVSWAATYWALLMEMGTGKTKVAIDTVCALYEAGELDTALILAPKGVYDNWVKNEIPTHTPDRIVYRMVRWQPNITKKFQEEIESLAYREEGDTSLHILVMNIEALSTPKGAGTAEKFLLINPNSICIVDESTTIKNPKAARTKAVTKAGKNAKYRRILTGSPITKSPMDLYSQCAFLSNSALGFNSFYAFQSRYAVIARRTMGHRSFQEITGYRRLDELGNKLNRFATRITKDECLDLPDKIYMKREVALTKEQMTAYVQMQKLALARLEKGELATTQSVLTQIMRLQSICCGHIQPDDGPIIELKNNRMTELMDILEEVSGKVIIWATWTYDIHRIEDAIKKTYGPRSVSSYYGGTEQDRRQEIVNEFQDPDSDLRFFIGQPKTGGYGITLTAATTMVYYSNSYDLEIRLQSEDRAHRIGQKSNVTYIDLVSPNTIDEKILSALRDKIDIAGQVLGEDVKQWLL